VDEIISIFLWAGLEHEDSTLTLSKVERWMTTHAQESALGRMDTLKQYMEVIGDAIVESIQLSEKLSQAETDLKTLEESFRKYKDEAERRIRRLSIQKNVCIIIRADCGFLVIKQSPLPTWQWGCFYNLVM
jgi:hypothetical protein